MLYEYEVIVEEALELGGWLLIAAALIATGLDLLVRRVRPRVAPAARTVEASEQRPVDGR
jgi:hypothetical protein